MLHIAALGEVQCPVGALLRRCPIPTMRFTHSLRGGIDRPPLGYSGRIKVTNPQSIFAPGVAIFSYDAEEVENAFGNRMTARYHQTDTWLLGCAKRFGDVENLIRDSI